MAMADMLPIVCRYSPKVRADIGRYARLHGSSAAATYLSRKFGNKVSVNTVHSIKKVYEEEAKTKLEADSDDEVKVIPFKKRGRPLLLGEELDTKVQLYLKKVREGGGIVTARIAIGAARGILCSCDRFRLAEFGDPVELNPHWAYRLLDRMHFVRQQLRASTL